MITSFEALEWLNAIDGHSCLTDEERGLSMAARVASHSHEDARRLLDNLRDAGLSSGDPLERAEVALHLAAIEYWLAWYAEVVQDAREALRIYRNDQHRRAVAKWILAMAQWQISQNHGAYTNCSEAKQCFRERARELRDRPHFVDWYNEWAWQMDLELTAKPEEIYTWLNWFQEETTSLTSSSRQLENFITENIGQQRYSDVYALMRDMQQSSQWSTDIYERAEVSFECGLAAYQMGNLGLAIELLKKAVQNFSPGLGHNHKQVVARCMLGAVEWMHPGLRNQAAISWRRCIEEFRELKVQTDYANNQARPQWYAERIDLLEAALSERLPGSSPQGKKPRRPDPPPSAPGSPPPDESPGPDTPPPDERDRFSYENLLRKVGGDILTAERLIEYERRRAPNASREELIRRAIERWEDDNR
jgi:tetratricopeptide (TPR) repeat protein